MKVLGVAAGNGTLLYPLKRYLVGNIEFRADFFAAGAEKYAQWKANFGDKPIHFSNPPFEGHGVDVIIGHPDCGHSSNLAYSRAKKLGDSKNNDSIRLFISCIDLYKPKVFLFENLPAFFKTYGQDNFKAHFPDYTFVTYIGPVSLWGNSQVSRERLVIIGLRNGTGILSSDFELPKQESIKLKVSAELEAGLKYPDEKLLHLREDPNTVVCMEKDFKKLNLKEIKKIWNSAEYQTRKKWDATTTGKGRMKNLPGVYRNLADQYPLTARKQNRQFNSKGDIMSPRELARIQGIPDEFILYYNPKNPQYWINKARVTATKCPPYEIGAWFAQCLLELKEKCLLK